jgi:hypothetical protein
MLMTLLTLGLLAAEPSAPAESPPAPSATPPAALMVGVTFAPELEKVADEAGRSLASYLAAPPMNWRGYLKSRAEGCARELRCLLAAPALTGTPRLVHLRLRPLGGGRLAVDLRLLDVRGRKVLGRRAAVVEAAELGAWSEAAATRLIARADPSAGRRSASPYTLQPPR